MQFVELKEESFKRALIVNCDNFKCIMPYIGNLTDKKKNLMAIEFLKFLKHYNIKYHANNDDHALSMALLHIKMHSLNVVNLKIKNYIFTHDDMTEKNYIDFSYFQGASMANNINDVYIKIIK
jgi:hypothetical protein